MNFLDQKINEYFQGLVVRKDLVMTVKGNAIVPTYVLEYLLGRYCATDDEPTIQNGIETVFEHLLQHPISPSRYAPPDNIHLSTRPFRGPGHAT